MGEHPTRPDDPPVYMSRVERSRGSGVVFALVAIALVLAIGFFYMTNDHRKDRAADSVTHAADSVDDAAKVVGQAAKNAADTLRNQN